MQSQVAFTSQDHSPHRMGLGRDEIQLSLVPVLSVHIGEKRSR